MTNGQLGETSEGRSGGTLAGKTIIVTGGSRGIGRAIALRLAREGGKLVLAARDAATLAKVVAEIEAGGGTATSVATDLCAPEAPAALVEAALQEHGAIDIIVNNAGATRRGDFLALTETDWMEGFALKFFGAVRLTRAAWSHLKKRRGSVLNIIGVGGRTSQSEDPSTERACHSQRRWRISASVTVFKSMRSIRDRFARTGFEFYWNPKRRSTEAISMLPSTSLSERQTSCG